MRDFTLRSQVPRTGLEYEHIKVLLFSPLDYSSLRPYLLKLGLHFGCFL